MVQEADSGTPKSKDVPTMFVLFAVSIGKLIKYLALARARECV